VKILVTGASGFIGGYVVENLLGRGHDVLALDRLRGPRRLHKAEGSSAAVWHYLGDVRDATAVTEAVALSDGVIHLAGVLGTAETIDNPLPAIESNILGSLNIFQACRQHRKRCAYITVGNWFMHSAYAITKTTAENLAWMFNQEHSTEIAVVRALNAYGPRQKAAPVRKIVPNFVLPALRGEAITIYGDGESIMDMVWVGDVAEVLVRALLEEHGRFRFEPEPYAVNPVKFEAGTGRRTTVNAVAQMVIEAVGTGTVQHLPMRRGEPQHSVVLGDPETLRPLYDGAVPALRTLEDGLRDTVGWYRKHTELWT